jgi:hypothetical protein
MFPPAPLTALQNLHRFAEEHPCTGTVRDALRQSTAVIEQELKRLAELDAKKEQKS